MKKKRILFLFVTLFASTLLYSQVVGVKTNLVMDAMKIINLGAEVGLSMKLTLDLYANYNPLKYKEQKMMNPLYDHFGDRLKGHVAANPDGKTARVRVKVIDSPQFRGWIAGMDGKIEVIER